VCELDELLSEAVAHKDVPFAVAMVANRDGVLWEGHSGERTPSVPADLDTSFRLFSMTKAIGSLAALLMVERGRFALDTAVIDVLPDFGRLQVLESMGPDGPEFSPPRRPVTLRDLLTHTSGLMYCEYEPRKLRDWQMSVNAPHQLEGTRESLFSYPMVSHPGDQWVYGLGADWAGLMIEAVDGRRVDQFVREEVLEPLAMHHTVFDRVDCLDTLAELKTRGKDGSFEPTEMGPPSSPEVYGLGHALFGTAPDYIRFLRMVLNRGELDGERIISSEGIEPMFTNQIGSLDVQMLRSLAPDVALNAENFPGRRKTHTIGFLRLEESVPEMRGEGSLFWAGVCNTHFWIDPEKDLAAVLMTQTLPFFEPRVMQTLDEFERRVYRIFS